VFIEGRLPGTIHARGENVLPTAKKFGELRPRLFVTTVSGAGRAVWTTFRTAAGSLGMPADARKVIAVGAASGDGKPQPTSASAPAATLSLLKKPDVLAYDEGAGTGRAAAFAAGLVACTRGSKAGLAATLEGIRDKPGVLLKAMKK